MKKYFLLSCMVLICPLAWGQITYRDVEVQGSGSSLQKAINNGLVEAIGRVNGKSIDAVNQINKLSKTTRIDGKKSRSSKKEIQRAYKEATNGVVASYNVLSQQKVSERRWKVIIQAKIAKYKRSKTANRRRIAVIPFRISSNKFVIRGSEVDKTQVNRILGQSLVSQLVQTRRFTVLDREYLEELTGEKSIILSGKTPLEEIAKLGEELVADYIVVGTLENLSFKENEVKMQTSDRVFKSQQGNIEVNYRVIDVATKQIKFSDFARLNVNPDDLSRVDSSLSLENAETTLCLIAADRISKKVLNAIYPMLVVAVNGKNVTLNQGGNMLKVGDQYEVFRYGNRIFDPYTKESIGRQENYIGTIEISRVNPKSSHANIISAEVDFTDVFAPKALVCRLKEESMSPARKQMLEIDERREKRKQDRDDDW